MARPVSVAVSLGPRASQAVFALCWRRYPSRIFSILDPTPNMPSIPISILLNPEPIHYSAPRIPVSMLLNPLPDTPLSARPVHDLTRSQCAGLRLVNDSLQRTLLHTQYKSNRQTILSRVYQYPPEAVLEYPETGRTDDELVGHLFEMVPGRWDSPGLDFAYSRGEPRGQERSTCSLLVDVRTGDTVPCTVKHSTCRGVKVCPFYETDEDSDRHSSATRDQLQTRMIHSKEQQTEAMSPQRDVFEKTSAYLTALMRVGCTSESNQLDTGFSPPAVDTEERTALRRGYPEIRNRCTGRLFFKLDFEGNPYIKCEHHSRLNRDHFFDNTIGNGRFDLEYLEAVLTEDQEEVERIESEAQLEGYGPRASCHTIMNNSAQRLSCPWTHRDGSNHTLKQPQLISLKCRCIFREYVPLEEYRPFCPYVVITSKGPHSHPIPLPEKTPKHVKLELGKLFKKLEVDLADMTPRKFLRHPILQSYLSSRYPMLRNPMLSDLHISLSNRSHLKVYIEHAKKTHFPNGTGWQGLLHIKTQQDELLAPTDRYLRVILELPDAEVDDDEADVPDDQAFSCEGKSLRIAICMTSAASKRMIEAQYLQSDIGFKRIVGFYEFEIASLDRYSNTSFTFCRVYLTRQTAEAHRIVLNEIDKILRADTGRGLHFRHLHSHNANNYNGLVLNWVVDQHRGQAKGIGLYVQDLTRGIRRRFDFHEPTRYVQDLSPYDHLRRFLTLCTTHLYRKIRTCSVSEEVKRAMQSLICITHDDWEETIEFIRIQGGKEGRNWVLDKESSKFAFAGMCWEQSLIPIDVWKARLRESNVVEVVHANVNMEGKKCTLVGGLYKGRHYDLMKQRFLANREDFGIGESYSSKHQYENAMKNSKRKSRSRRKNLLQEDAKIKAHNTKITMLHEKWVAAHKELKLRYELLYPSTSSSAYQPSQSATRAYDKVKKQEEKAQKAYREQVKVGEALGGTGSGKVLLVLPQH